MNSIAAVQICCNGSWMLDAAPCGGLHTCVDGDSASWSDLVGIGHCRKPISEKTATRCRDLRIRKQEAWPQLLLDKFVCGYWERNVARSQSATHWSRQSAEVRNG